MKSLFLFCTLQMSLIGAAGAAIAHAGEHEALPVPRFVTIKSQEVNARTGPNLRYPIRWTFIKKNEPVEIVAEFDLWRQIRDIYGDEGWVHKSMLSGKRVVVITGEVNQALYEKPDPHAAIIAYVEPAVRAELLSCKEDWCKIKPSRSDAEQQLESGWVERKVLWGVYTGEKIP